jgi:hypothetical protein
MKRLIALMTLACALLPGRPSAASAETGATLHLSLNQTYLEAVADAAPLPLNDPKALFALVLQSLPDQVKVYPTENYFYFSFMHDGSRYAGNIRLDASDRDRGKVHFAYFIDLAEWKDQDAVQHVLLGLDHGVRVTRLAALRYEVAIAGKRVEFELNDLSGVKPPDGLLASDERYIGPVFDESGIRFFLVYNGKLKLFHYLLDETIRVGDRFFSATATDRIMIGKRTGFAFYRDHHRERKILIGVFEGNSRVNNLFDGPFDQMPDNFIEGESLRSAILDVQPSLAGKIDRFGGSPDGQDRYLIAPYLHYRYEDDLMVFHTCATSKSLPRNMYYACFVFDADDGSDAIKPPPDKKPPQALRKNLKIARAAARTRH